MPVLLHPVKNQLITLMFICCYLLLIQRWKCQFSCTLYNNQFYGYFMCLFFFAGGNCIFSFISVSVLLLLRFKKFVLFVFL